MRLLLVVNNLWEFSNTTIQPPMSETKLTKDKKNDAKARLLIVDVVRDHIIPHISGKKATR